MPEIEKELGAQNYCYKVKKEGKDDPNCSHALMTSIKFISVLNGPNNVSMTYNRGCTIGGGRIDFCLTQYVRDPEVKCYLCNEDRCNDGNVLRIVKILTALSTITSIINAYFGHDLVM